MGLFKNKKLINYTIIIGCGRLGAKLANTLSDAGENVLVMDQNKVAFNKLSPAFGGLTITGDGTDFDALEAAQISQASVVVVVTNNDNANVMIAQMVRELFKVQRVIARLYDPQRECIYQEFGIDTICPVELSAMEINKILTKSEMLVNKERTESLKEAVKCEKRCC